MMARLRTLIPWIDDHIRAMDTACLTRDPQTGRLDFNLSELVPIVNEPLPMTLNASSLAPKTAYKNILMGGDALFGGLGFEGLCLGALQTLEHAQQIVKLKTSLKGDTL